MRRNDGAGAKAVLHAHAAAMHAGGRLAWHVLCTVRRANVPLADCAGVALGAHAQNMHKKALATATFAVSGMVALLMGGDWWHKRVRRVRMA